MCIKFDKTSGLSHIRSVPVVHDGTRSDRQGVGATVNSDSFMKKNTI